MIESEAPGDNFKEIEDVIDARKRLGQYNVYKHVNPLITRCLCSRFPNPTDVNRATVKFDEASLVPPSNGTGGVRHTDSEITIVRVKCSGEGLKTNKPANNKWDMMNDIAIPGDGTHLAESPSMVNLATLVSQNLQCEGDDEYLVPLSSWEPFIKTDDISFEAKNAYSDSKVKEKYILHPSSTEPNVAWRVDISSSSAQTEDWEDRSQTWRRQSWAGKFSKFLRSQWRKSNRRDDTEMPEIIPSAKCQHKRN